MKRFSIALLALCTCIAVSAQPEVQWDRHSLIIDGRRVVAVMGEIHYSRLPENEWQAEIHKMKEGGVTIIANYVFWNHVEEHQGVFNWSGQRSLRRFLEVCKAEGLPVCLRIGPFCHGEARNGGIPDWVVNSGCKMRSEDPQFISYVETLYRQIFTQVQGLQWKDGGPVLACQFDNEFGGNGSYLMRLKSIAQAVGFDLPFYTRTGWPELRTPVPFGEMIPLYGDYADGFWDRSTKETAGNYYKAFNFRASPISGAIGSEQLDYSQTQNSNQETPNSTYPYFTCELGGGMMTSYHRRCFLYPEDAYSMAVVKLGSGSNLLGYYMYHGGTNPTSQWRPGDSDLQPYEGDRTVYLNETQRCSSTNHNDLPVLTYDFQAPLGEFGQINPHYYLLRKLHLFMADFGEELAPMEVTFPNPQDIKKGQDDFLRWSYRSLSKTLGEAGVPAFVFINNYERLQQLSDKRNVRFDVCGVQFPKKAITIPAATTCIFPVNIAGLRYATAQLVARREGRIYLEQIRGIPTELAFSDGKTLRNVKAQGTTKPVYTTQDGTAYYLVDSETAGRLFLDDGTGTQDRTSQTSASSSMKASSEQQAIPFRKIREAGPLRTITIGAKNVAQEPLDSDFDNAAIYTIDLPQDSTLFTLHSTLLHINYQGDCARLYADGQLIDDNFYNGRPFLYGLWRLSTTTRQLELRILPLQKDAPIYFPREADTTPGENLMDVTLVTSK